MNLKAKYQTPRNGYEACSIIKIFDELCHLAPRTIWRNHPFELARLTSWYSIIDLPLKDISNYLYHSLGLCYYIICTETLQVEFNGARSMNMCAQTLKKRIHLAPSCMLVQNPDCRCWRDDPPPKDEQLNICTTGRRPRVDFPSPNSSGQCSYIEPLLS